VEQGGKKRTGEKEQKKRNIRGENFNEKTQVNGTQKRVRVVKKESRQLNTKRKRQGKGARRQRKSRTKKDSNKMVGEKKRGGGRPRKGNAGSDHAM